MNSQKLLTILISKNDTWHDVPLYEAVCRKLVQLGAPGATVHSGIMGFGSHHRIHHAGLFGLTDDKPVSISVVSSEEMLRTTLIPAVRGMVKNGLIFLTDVEVVG